MDLNRPQTPQGGGIVFETVVLDFTVPPMPEMTFNSKTGELTIYCVNGTPNVVQVPRNEQGESVFPFVVECASGQRFKVDLVDDENDIDNDLETESRPQTSMSVTRIEDAPPPRVDYMMRVQRAIPGNPNRIDYHRNNAFIASGFDIPLQVDSILTLSVVRVAGADTTRVNDENIRWYVNNTIQHTGYQFRYRVLVGENNVRANLASGDTILLITEPAAVVRAATTNRVRLDNSRLTNITDTVRARRYFDVAFRETNPRILRNDLLTFVNAARRDIVIITENNPPVDGVLREAQASDGAVVTALYDSLRLMYIRKDADNVIIDARLVSSLTPTDRRNIDASAANNGRLNQSTEVLLHKIARLSTQQADTLRAMISRNEVRPTFLDSVRFEITAADNLSNWIRFHSEPTINVYINMRDRSGGRINEREFIRLTAHELLHHWWTHFRGFESLKWRVIRRRAPDDGFSLGDGFRDGASQNSNRGCSAVPRHERHNPEHEKVCRAQNDY